MKNYFVMGALALVSASSLFADMVPAKATTATTKTTSTVSKEGPVNRQLEVRIGPRITFLTGDIRVGKTGTDVDIWDDLGLKEVGGGIKLDTDWQPFDRLHITSGFTWDHFDITGSTKSPITSSKGDVVQPGATLTLKADIYTFDGTVGYDVVKNNLYRLTPYFGGKGGAIDGELTASGSVLTAPPGSRTVTGTRTTTGEDVYGAFIVGIDQRFNITRNWYTGLDIAGSAWEDWGYLTGDGYMGYDFSKTWGVRAGYAFDYITYENPNKSTEANPLLGAIYMQAVWGF
jgi:hypothetical protein